MTQSNGRLESLFRKEALLFPKYSLSENEKGFRLHQNENHGLTDDERREFAEVLATTFRDSRSINIYPNLTPHKLLQAYASVLRISVEHLEVTAGSSQALTLIAEALFAPGRRVAITSPSFSLYGNLARLYGSEVVDIGLNDEFEFTEHTLFSDDVLNSHVAIICSPNNPTGTLCPKNLLLKFADEYRGLLVVDEAYIEFCEEPKIQSFVREAIERDNVVVLRTLSKAWGAAGLRIGGIVSHADIIELFRALKPPYSIASPSEELAHYILEKKLCETNSKIIKIKEKRNQLQSLLSRSYKVMLMTQSEANFIFLITEYADLLEENLFKNGFIVRRYNSGRLENAVRISMPPDSEFDHLRNILVEVLR